MSRAPDTRAAFEAHYRKECGMPDDVAIQWDTPYIAAAWDGWQSALTWQAATEVAKADDAKLPPPELTWLYSHCRAIGMDCKSNSGKWEEDICLWTINLTNEIRNLRAEAAKATGIAGELPPLPKAVREKIDMPPQVRAESVVTSAHYTADQMREYGQACAQAAWLAGGQHQHEVEKAARQPAQVAIKTWRERIGENFTVRELTSSRDTEIAELRAALAAATGSQP